MLKSAQLRLLLVTVLYTKNTELARNQG